MIHVNRYSLSVDSSFTYKATSIIYVMEPFSPPPNKHSDSVDDTKTGGEKECAEISRALK